MTTAAAAAGQACRPRRRNGAIASAWGLIGVAIAAPALSRTARWPVHHPSVLGVVSVLPLLFVGAFLALRGHGGAVGWLLLAGGLAQVLTGSLLPDVQHARPTEAVAQWLGLVATASYNQMFVILALAALLFPDGRLPGRRWRWFVVTAVTASLLFVVITPVPWRDVTVLRPLKNPIGVAALAPLGALFDVAVALVGVTIVGSLAGLLTRWRGGDGQTRAQLAWVLWAVAVSGAVLAAGLTYGVLTGTVSSPWLDLATGGVFQVLVPLAIGIAVTCRRLYGIDVVINRTMTYGILTAALVLLYVGVVAGAGQLAHGAFPPLLAAALVALAISPLRAAVQRLLSRRLFGYRQEPYEAIAELSRRMAGQLSPVLVPTTIVEGVAGALRLPYAALAIPSADEYTIVASAGQPVGTPLELDLSYQGESVGLLLVSPRSPNEVFRPHERRLLDELARHAGIAVSAAQLTTDLQRSRARLAAAREEERRRIWRELHDGLGPTLAGVSFGIEAARNQLPDDMHVSGLLSTLGSQVLDAIADVRRIVQDLRPTALDQLGLEGALLQYSRSLRVASGLDVTVECSGPLTDIPPLVEAAAYRIAMEGLTNAARHARARGAIVLLRADQAKVLVEVIDDGCGFGAGQPTGGGLVTMRQRAAELGGTCSIGPAPAGGTQVHAVLPTRQP